MGSKLRLRGPWIVRGAGLDTAVTSQSGTIGIGGSVQVAMSAYTFMPDILGRTLFQFLDLRVRYGFIGVPDADAPILVLFNLAGVSTPYAAHWRHINP